MSSSQIGHLGKGERNNQLSSVNPLIRLSGLKYCVSKTQNSIHELAGYDSEMPSAAVPGPGNTLHNFMFIPHTSFGWCVDVVSMMSFGSQPAFADPLNTMKAREFLQKGNNHLNRYEFQQALDAYTECLLCDPNNRTAREQHRIDPQ